MVKVQQQLLMWMVLTELLLLISIKKVFQERQLYSAAINRDED